MTFVGKVLVVVQVALSLLFMAFATVVYTVQTNWKTEAEKLRADIVSRDQQYNDLDSRFTTFQNEQTVALQNVTAERDMLAAQNTTLEARRKSAEDALQTAQAEIKSLTAQLKLAKEDAQAYAEQLRAQDVVIASLRGQVDQFRGELQQSRELAFQLQKDLEGAQAALGTAIQRERELRDKFAGIGVDPGTVQVAAENTPPPQVSGLVLETRKSQHGDIEYVEISIGRDDGLREGNELLVFRLDNGGKYLGRIQLIKVAADNAVGTVVEKAKNGIIQRGDHVATKL